MKGSTGSEVSQDARQGDTLLVWKLDWLGRSLRDLIGILDDLKARGVLITNLNVGLSSPKEISMSRPKMLILRGNSAPAGTYPDEQGKTIAWPVGALHVSAASEYAKRRGYEAIVLDVAGQPQNQESPQANAALKKFFEDQAVCAFYGFSGGGYNLRHILDRLASRTPDALHRIDLIVVLGAPLQPKAAYEAVRYNPVARKKVHPAKWEDARWEVVYGTNPPEKWALPKGVPEGTGKHMFGPEWLLAGMPTG